MTTRPFNTNPLDIPELNALILRGFPTFDEFQKNPDKWRQNPEEIFESISTSSLAIKDLIKTQRLWWRDQYKVKSEEQLEKICREEGYTGNDIELEVFVRPLHGTSAHNEVETIVRVWPKMEYRLRGGIVAND
jgi:hypothetical protein